MVLQLYHLLNSSFFSTSQYNLIDTFFFMVTDTVTEVLFLFSLSSDDNSASSSRVEERMVNTKKNLNLQL